MYLVFQHGLMTQLLRLAHNCLTFDFIGTSTDESSDDLCTVQIPTSWRPAFLDFSTLKLFFDLYHSLPNTLSPLVSQFILEWYFSELLSQKKTIGHIIALHFCGQALKPLFHNCIHWLPVKSNMEFLTHQNYCIFTVCRSSKH